MDKFDRYFRRSLRDVFVGQGILTAEQAEELTISAEENNEPLGGVVVDAGYLSHYELTRLVSANYQMPVIPVIDLRVNEELVEGLPATVLHEHRVFPVGKFGDTWTFVVSEPPSRTCVAELIKHCGESIFFFTTLGDELSRLIRDSVSLVDAKKDASWQNIFEAGDERVLREISESK